VPVVVFVLASSFLSASCDDLPGLPHLLAFHQHYNCIVEAMFKLCVAQIGAVACKQTNIATAVAAIKTAAAKGAAITVLPVSFRFIRAFLLCSSLRTLRSTIGVTEHRIFL
jgi:hypothetical protein